MRCAAATALQSPPPRRVYDGDRPGHALRHAALARPWEQVQQDLNTMLETACHNPSAVSLLAPGVIAPWLE
jgi:hypothetical protein